MRFLRMLPVITASLALTVALTPGTSLAQGGDATAASAPQGFTLTSTSFPDGSIIPDKYTQAGEQISPALSWTNVPAGTVTFVLHMHDPEDSRNKTTEDQLHWLVWNIPATTTSLPEGVPSGRMQNGALQMSAGGPAYRAPGARANGPRHHYTFELIALDTKLDIQPSSDAFATRLEVMKAIQGHVLGKAVYMGLFRRPQ